VCSQNRRERADRKIGRIGDREKRIGRGGRNGDGEKKCLKAVGRKQKAAEKSDQMRRFERRKMYLVIGRRKE